MPLLDIQNPVYKSLEIGYGLITIAESIPHIKYLFTHYIPLAGFIQNYQFTKYISSYESLISISINLIGSSICIYQMPEYGINLAISSAINIAKPYLYSFENKLLSADDLDNKTWFNFAKYVAIETVFSVSIALPVMQVTPVTFSLVAAGGMFTGIVSYLNNNNYKIDSYTGHSLSFISTSYALYSGGLVVANQENLIQKILISSATLKAATLTHYVSNLVGNIIEDYALNLVGDHNITTT